MKTAMQIVPTLLAGMMIGIGPVQAMPANEQAALRDPWLPPAARQREFGPSPSGTALDARALARLQQRFEAADKLGKRSLSKIDAQAAGLGWIASRFEQIDTRGTGRVSFAEVVSFMRTQPGAAALQSPQRRE